MIKLPAISTAPYPQDKPPVWACLILIGLASVAVWAFIGAVVCWAVRFWLG